MMSDEMTLEERKVIYRSRRGLKEIDVYFDPYVKNYYLSADPTEKALFAELVDQEDPDLLDWFMEVGEAPRTEIKELIVKLKQYYFITYCLWGFGCCVWESWPLSGSGFFSNLRSGVLNIWMVRIGHLSLPIQICLYSVGKL